MAEVIDRLRGGYVSGKEILISVNSAQCVDRSHYQAS